MFWGTQMGRKWLWRPNEKETNAISVRRDIYFLRYVTKCTKESSLRNKIVVFFHTIFKTETAAKLYIKFLMHLISFKVKFQPFLIVFFLFRIVDNSSFQILKVWTQRSLTCGAPVREWIKFSLCYGYQPTGNLTRETIFRAYSWQMLIFPTSTEAMVSSKCPLNSGKCVCWIQPCSGG